MKPKYLIYGVALDIEIPTDSGFAKYLLHAKGETKEELIASAEIHEVDSAGEGNDPYPLIDSKADVYYAAMLVIAEKINEGLEAENKRLREALGSIWSFENYPKNHDKECELYSNIDERICTCGYWSMSFPQMKLMAWDALKEVGGWAHFVKT